MKRNLTTAKKLSPTKAWRLAKPLLGRLIKFTVLTVLALTLAVVILYVAGSYRNSPDEAQLVLVHIALALSLLLVISSVYGFLLNLYYAGRRLHAKYLLSAAGYILAIALGAAIALMAAFILGAVGGNLDG